MAEDGLISMWKDTRRLDRLVARFVAILLLVLAIVLVAFSSLTYLDVRARNDDQIRLDASALLQHQIDEETGVRGYDVTADRAFLKPYTDANSVMERDLRSLEARVSKRPEALAALENFRGKHDRWTAEVSKPVIADANDPNNAARQRIGRKLIDDERADIAELQRIYATEYDRLTAIKFAVRYLSMSIVLVVIIAIALTGYLAERRNMEREERLLRTIIAQRDEESRRGEWRSKIMAMLAHDFRSSLGVILAYTDMIESFPEKRQEHENYQAIRQAVYELTSMSEEALLMARVATNVLTVARVPIVIRDVIAEAARRYERERTIEIDGDHEEVLGDRRYLVRVFDNLISNAIKYSSSDVRVTIAKAGDTVEVRVTDRGRGIDAADLPHVFDEFWRAQSTSERSGSGIGLFIVKKIVEAHGGSASIESRTGEGTTVRIALPAAAPHPSLIAG